MSPRLFDYVRVFAAALLLAASAVGDTIENSPLEPADTSSPRAMLRGFMQDSELAYRVLLESGRAAENLETIEPVIRRLVQTCDMSEVPAYLHDYKVGEAIVCVREVIDRVGLPSWEEVPDAASLEEEGEHNGLQRWRVPATDITIVRLSDGPRQGEWVFSAETVDEAQTYFRMVRNLPYRDGACEDFRTWFLSEPGSQWLRAVVDQLPSWARARVWRQSVWQWAGLALVVIASVVAMIIAYTGGGSQAAVFKRSNLFRYWVTLWFPLAALAVPLVAKYVISRQFRISGTTLAVARFSCDVLFLVAVCVLILSAANRIAAALIARPNVQPRGVDAQLIRIATRLVAIIAVVIVFLEGGQNLGIPLTTLLAGAGVGGLTVALAAQDALKNLFGSLMIIIDRPFRVGERIAVGKFDGVVEEIGLRSTKLRLLTGHQVSVPNEEMARLQIENIGRRPHIRRIGDLALPLDTPPDKVRRALEIVTGVLETHEGQPADFPSRIFFDQVNRDALNLRFIYWYEPADYWAYVDFSQRFNLQVLDEFEKEGIELALPATEVEFRSGPDGVKAQPTST
ncbi:MAG: mechanosensitive ion channel family protein [Planctomycetota bacterium]